MKPMILIGAIVLILGIASLFVAIPQKEKHGVSAGGVSMGIETQTSEKVSPIISGTLIVVGAGLIIAGKKRG